MVWNAISPPHDFFDIVYHLLASSEMLSKASFNNLFYEVIVKDQFQYN